MIHTEDKSIFIKVWHPTARGTIRRRHICIRSYCTNVQLFRALFINIQPVLSLVSGLFWSEAAPTCRSEALLLTMYRPLLWECAKTKRYISHSYRVVGGSFPLSGGSLNGCTWFLRTSWLTRSAIRTTFGIHRRNAWRSPRYGLNLIISRGSLKSCTVSQVCSGTTRFPKQMAGPN